MADDDPKPHPTDPDPLPPVEPAPAKVTLGGTMVMPTDPLDEAPRSVSPTAASAGTTIPEELPAGARAISNTMPDALEALERTTVDDGALSAATEGGEPTTGDRNTMDDEVPADPAAAPDADADAEGDVDGEEPPPPPVEGQVKKRRKLWPFFLIGALLLVAIATPIAYILVFRYDPTAVKHIPGGTVMAFRIDAKELYLWKPFREHVVGKFDGSKEAKERASKLKKLTGIDLTSDLREIVVATPDAVRWVVLIGGYFHEARFNRSDVVKGLKTFLEEQGATDLTVKGGILYGPNGLEVTQAEDSTVIIANDHGLLQAAIPESDEWTSLGLAGSGGMSFVITENALQRFKSSASSMMLDPGMFGHSKRLGGYLKLGSKPQLNIEVVPRQVSVDVLSNEIEGTLGNLRGIALLLLPDTYGVKRMLQSIKVKPRADVVMLTADWPYDGLEDAMKAAGENVEKFTSGRALLDLALPSPGAPSAVAAPTVTESAPPPPASEDTPPAPPSASVAPTSTPTPKPETPAPYKPPHADPTTI
ncbi:MAG: hypothetical protein U0414_42675 [Polyangiaceae bacterium]